MIAKLHLYIILMAMILMALSYMICSWLGMSEYILPSVISIIVLAVIGIGSLSLGYLWIKGKDENGRGVVIFALIAVKFILSLLAILILYVRYRDENTLYLIPFIAAFLFFSPLISYTFTRLGKD